MNTESLAKVHGLFSESSRLKFVKSFDDVSLVVEHTHPFAEFQSRYQDQQIDEEPIIGYLFLHRKKKPVNILDHSLLFKCQQLLNDHIYRLVSDNKLHALVVYSVKDGFMAGIDVDTIYQISKPHEATRLSEEANDLLLEFERLPIPTVAAIHGTCLGGGLELALSCSHRVASDDKSTILGFPDIKLGLLPGAGGTVRLPQMIGLSEALQLILTGANIDARRAKRLFIVDEVFSIHQGEVDFFQKVKLYAMQLALNPFNIVDKYSRRPKSVKKAILEKNPIGRSIMEYRTNNYLNTLTKGRYPAPYVALETVMKTYAAATLEEAAKIEAESFGKLACTKQAKSLISLFQMIEATKTVLNFCNPTKVVHVSRIGVVGSGIMGSGITQLAALKGHQVYMKDIDEAFVKNGVKRIDALFRQLVAREKITEEDRVTYMSHVTAGVTYTQLADSDIVIEAAVEREDIKQDILRAIEELNPNVIFATNSSSIPITNIASVARRKENVLGMHFFNPVHKMPLVEIVKTKYSSESAIATVYQLALDLGKIPIIVNDGPGFLTTRLFAVYSLEAARLALEGCPIEQIDAYMYDFGMPMGPFRVMDESGLDIGLSVFPVLLKKLGLDFDQYSALHDLVKGESASGRKAGKGFYLYDSRGKRLGVNPAAIRIFHKYRETAANPHNKFKPTELYTRSTQYVRESKKDIIDRCILTLLNEATRCMEEGIVTKPEDVDLGMVLGIGFPPFRGGGLLGYCDQRGVVNVVKRLQELARKYGDRFRPTSMLIKMAKNSQRFFPERIVLNPNKSTMNPRL